MPFGTAIHLPGEAPLEFQPEFPPHFTGPYLPGASVWSAKTNIAQLVIQELEGDLFSLRFTVGKFLKNLTATGWMERTGLYSFFMIKSGVRKEIGETGIFHLRQDQYSAIYTGPTLSTSRFEKNKEFRTLDVFYSPDLLRELVPYFPALGALIQSERQFVMQTKACWSLPTMAEITNQFLHCPYDEATRRFYFELKVRELLYHILENDHRTRNQVKQFTPWEVAKIHEVRDLLSRNLESKPLSIRALARKVAINEYKLKTGFRQYFNSGIFEWVMDRKMEHARQLLLTTNKPIKEIGQLVGYPRTTNFITAFRRRFGMTPGSLRR